MATSKEHIGLKIKRLRAFRGLTQDGLAKALGKSRSLVAFLERTGNVNRYTLSEICAILKTSPQELEEDNYHRPDDGAIANTGSEDKDELIERLMEENRFLKETIQQQWNLFKEFKNGK